MEETKRGTITVANKYWPGVEGVNIARPSVYGNPFSHKTGTRAEFVVNSRDAAVDSYWDWVVILPAEHPLIVAMEALAERLVAGEDITLICSCKPARCHGDVLKELIEYRADEIIGE